MFSSWFFRIALGAVNPAAKASYGALSKRNRQAVPIEFG